MAEISVTSNAAGEVHVGLTVGPAPMVRDSVPLDALEEADRIPALDGLILDFDHYGRLIGIRVVGSPGSVLDPTLLDAATPE